LTGWLSVSKRWEGFRKMAFTLRLALSLVPLLVLAALSSRPPNTASLSESEPEPRLTRPSPARRHPRMGKIKPLQGSQRTYLLELHGRDLGAHTNVTPLGLDGAGKEGPSRTSNTAGGATNEGGRGERGRGKHDERRKL